MEIAMFIKLTTTFINYFFPHNYMAESVLGNVIEFMRNVGFYDVILPFLLVFSMMYAILDKTMVLGTEGKDMPRKSINSLVAFVVALFFIGVTKLVAVLNQAVANTTMFLIIITFIILTISVFQEKGQYDLLKHPGLKGWIVFVVIV